MGERLQGLCKGIGAVSPARGRACWWLPALRDVPHVAAVAVVGEPCRACPPLPQCALLGALSLVHGMGNAADSSSQARESLVI